MTEINQYSIRRKEGEPCIIHRKNRTEEKEDKDTTKPKIKSFTCSKGTSFKETTGTVTFKASASDNIKVTKMELILDGVGIGSTSSSSLSKSVQGSALKAGKHYLEIRVYDAAGNVATKKLTITVK